jgi:hypothetical protein
MKIEESEHLLALESQDSHGIEQVDCVQRKKYATIFLPLFQKGIRLYFGFIHLIVLALSVCLYFDSKSIQRYDKDAIYS